MTQQLQTLKEDKQWVLVSVIKENTTDYDLVFKFSSSPKNNTLKA